MRIMIVELDAALGLFLKKALTAEGHTVTWTNCTHDALSMAQTTFPNLVVLDIAAQEEADLLAALPTVHPQTCVLALAGRNTVEDRIRYLDLGADDCMTKPFSFHELSARCRALLRRQSKTSEGEVILTHGDLHLNRISRVTTVSGHSLSLTTKEFRLLEFLMKNVGRSCTRSELLQEVFELPANNATNVVDVYINYLRKKLSVAEGSVRILTVRGTGYCLARAEPLELPRLTVESNGQYANA